MSLIITILPEIGFGGKSLLTDNCILSSCFSDFFTNPQFPGAPQAGIVVDRRITRTIETANIFTDRHALYLWWLCYTSAQIYLYLVFRGVALLKVERDKYNVFISHYEVLVSRE